MTFPKSGRSHAEYEILSQMLSGISASNYYKEELGFLKDDTCNKLAIYIIDYYRTHTLMEIADLLDTIKEETVKTLAPVSYTHLDVYKRQVCVLIDIIS